MLNYKILIDSSYAPMATNGVRLTHCKEELHLMKLPQLAKVPGGEMQAKFVEIVGSYLPPRTIEFPYGICIYLGFQPWQRSQGTKPKMVLICCISLMQPKKLFIFLHNYLLIYNTQVILFQGIFLLNYLT